MILQSFRSRALWRPPSTAACGAGDYPTPDLTQSELESRSAPGKSVQFGPDGAPFPSKTSISLSPQEPQQRSRRTPYYPTDSQLQIYDIYIIRRVLLAAHARDVNIFIWTSRKSVDHGTNDRVMVHGDGTRADGRRSEPGAQINKMWARELALPGGAFGSRNPM